MSTAVTEAFAALIAALKAEAVSGDFDRTTAYLRRAQDMAARWENGAPAFTPRKRESEG
jgi:hypothetical protein